MMTRRTCGSMALVSLIVWLGKSCTAHVSLEAPPPNASPAERLAAYEALRPINYEVINTVTYRRSYRDAGTLDLNGGRHILLPEDLLPLVDPGSSAAASMREARKHRHHRQLLTLGAYGGMLSAFILGVTSLTRNFDKPLAWTGAGLGVGGLICIPLVNREATLTSASTTRAYQEYDQELRRRLALCSDGDQLLPCR